MLHRLLSPLQRMTRGGIAGLIAVLALAGVVAFFGAARWVNTSPSRCATCHPELTAMWARSQGHSAEKVSCYQCHAGHAEPPASLNVGAVVRDQLVPEKYTSADHRIEARCESCHGALRDNGTGEQLIAGKELLKLAANRIEGGELKQRELPLPAVLLSAPDSVAGGELLGAAARQLRDAEWRAAFHAIRESGGGAAGVREHLEFSSQSLRWARIRSAKVRAGVVARVGSKLNQYKAGMGRVRRGADELSGLLLLGDAEITELDAATAEQARAVLEEMSRGLKSAARARTAAIRELEGMEDALFNPDLLAKALRVVPRALKKAQLDRARQGLENAIGLLAGAVLDEPAIAARAETRGEELTVVLQEKLSRLKVTFGAVLADLPAGPAPAVTGSAVVQSAEVSRVQGVAAVPEPVANGSVGGDPQQVVSAAYTAVRSLQVSLAAASNLGWADFSLRDSHVIDLAERFEALGAAFAAAEKAAPDAAAVRRTLEAAVDALASGAAADGLRLTFAVRSNTAQGAVAVSLPALVNHGVDALLALEQGFGDSKVIKVNHKVHFQQRVDASGRAVDLGCLDCHRNIAHDKAQLETFRPRMAACFVSDCHRKDRNKDNCRRCHFQQLSELAVQKQ